MADINRQDIWPDDLLSAPLQYAGNVNEAIKATEKLMSISKASGEAIANSTQVGKAAKEIDNMTLAQKELEKVNNQISVAVAKNNDEYRKQQEVLAQVKQELKEKSALGKQDAKNVDAQNNSIKELTAALKANRDAYDKLASAEQRNSKEGKALLAVIQQQDKDLKNLKTEMGQNQLKVGDYEGAIKGLRTELKLARDQMAGIAATLGTTSPEFIAAAEKAGSLKDQINDVNDAMKNTEASPFENLGNTFADAGKKLLALDFGGAANSAKQFANASKAITFKEAIKGVKDMGTTFSSLGKALLTNPLFLIAAVVIGIVVAVVKLKDKIPFLTEVFDAVGGAIDWVIQKLKDFGDWLGLTSFAAEEKADRIVAASKKEAEAISKRYDDEIKLAAAAGEKTSYLEVQKQQAIKQTAIESKKALDDYLKESGLSFKNLTDDQKAAYEEAVRTIHDANIEIRAIIRKEDKERRDILEKQKKEAADAAKEDAKIKADAAKWVQDYIKSQPSEVAKREKEEEDLRFNRLKDVRDKLYTELKIQGNVNDAILQSKIALEKKLAAAEEAGRQYRLQKTKENLELTKQIYTDVVNSIGNLFSVVTANRIANIDREKEAVTEQLNRDLELAGNNEAAKEQIRIQADRRQKELERKKIAEQRKFAIFEKAVAAISAGIQTSLNVLKAFPNPVLMGLATALGAINIAAILAKPIPQYEFGTKSAKGGMSIVGEAGTELVKTPSGKTFLTPNRASLMNIEKGSKVFTNEETMAMLGGVQGISGMKGDFVLYSKIGSLEETIKNSDAKIVDAIERTNSKLFTQGDFVYEMKRKKDGSKQMIRQKSLN